MKPRHLIATLSITGGVIAHLAILTILRIQDPLLREPFPEQAPVLFVGEQPEGASISLQQQASLLDSAPLFMPTRWNASSRMENVASLREATEIFQPFAPELRLPAVQLELAASLLPSSPSIAFPEGPGFLLAGFGQERSLLQLEGEAGPAYQVQPVSGSTLGEARTGGLPSALAAQAPPALWSPVLIFLQIIDGRPAGPAFVAESSGFAEWDEAVQDFANSLAFYGPLGDGYYRLSIVP